MSRATRLLAAHREFAEALPVSPWAGPAVLTPVEITGLWDGAPAMTRAEAMAVPAVAGARHRLVSVIAPLPLVARRDGTPAPVQPLWISRTDTGQSPAQRMAATVDDLLFFGDSLWLVTRDADDRIITADHCPHGDWRPDADGGFEIRDEPQHRDHRRVIYFPGLHEGILAFGAVTIRGASRTMLAAVDVAEHPIRLELHDTGDYPMSRDEQRQVVADARAAMASAGGVLFTTPGLEGRLHAVDAGAMMVPGREAFAVDIARLIGVPSAVIDAHSQGATMTYSTVADVLAHFMHLGATLYMTPITARLSLDDVTPRGVEVRFDLDGVLGAPALTDTTPEEAQP